MALKQRHQGNEMATSDKIIAVIVRQRQGKVKKRDSEFYLLKIEQRHKST